MAELTLDPATTAFVVIDLQQGIVGGETAPHASRDVVSRCAEIARRCRDRGALVVLVHVDPGVDGRLMPSPQADVPRPARSFPAEWSRIVPEMGPQSGDAVVTKHQPNAFYATDLEVQLTRRGIRTIVLGGISTNIGVEATARAAHERGYEQVFVEDAMSAREADLHAHSTTRIFPTMGRVRSSRDVLAAL